MQFKVLANRDFSKSINVSFYSDIQIGVQPEPQLPKFVTPAWLHDIAIKCHNRYVAERAAARAMQGAKMLTALQVLDRVNAQMIKARAQRDMNAALFGDMTDFAHFGENA